MMVKVAIHGAEGRMGRLLIELVEQTPDLDLVGLVTEPGRRVAVGKLHCSLPVMGQQEMAACLPKGCVIIDFSLAAALSGLLAAGTELGAGLVIGTTGYSVEQRDNLAKYAQNQAVVQAANFSIGVPAMQLILQLLARTLPGEFSAEQVETHHVTKRDQPSGTARHLADIWCQTRGCPEVPTHSLRLGGVIGEHSWTICDEEETLVVTHRAHTRRAFLRGVLPAVRFVSQQQAGFYNLTDVLQGLAAL